ncbi:hypothetical protein EVAR_54984_1 [Eumeta japonica]|uniref:Uncharacterized protein n=1 Tax=Eumeta variegata TaxID=151549 RepID=A0A4C1Z5P4_EUMVA|nr:hypothetical protein EVAR_54984_1 [Eumeta japonica]
MSYAPLESPPASLCITSWHQSTRRSFEHGQIMRCPPSHSCQLYHEPHGTDAVFGRRRRTSLAQVTSQVTATTLELVKSIKPFVCVRACVRV